MDLAILKRHSRILLLSSALVIPTNALAADLASPTLVRDWTGFYGGVNVGAMVGRTTPLEYEGPWDYGEYTKAEWALLGGVQIGLNNQVGNFVYGGEADFAFTSFDVDQSFDTTESNPGAWNWVATVRARAGIAVGNGVFFTTAGVAFVDADYSFGEPGDVVTDSGVKTGIALGAGYERAIDQNWSWRFDYLFIGLPNEEISDFDGDFGAFTSSAHTARFAFNYLYGDNEIAAETSRDPMTSGNWGGFYIGANVAGMLAQSSSLEYGGPWDYSEYTIEDWAGALGFQAGFNVQNGHSVLGVEADINVSSFDNEHRFDGGDYRNAAEWDWYATIRARAGLAAGNTLGYVTGGIAIVNPDYAFGEPTGSYVTSSPTEVGLVVGAGVEAAFTNRLSGRLEYLHIALPEDLITDFDGETGSFVSSAHLGRIAMNYALGDGIDPGTGTVLPDAMDWTGFYLGLVGGGMMVTSTATEYEGPWDYGEYSITDWAGSIGGIIGFNGQMANFVYGLEADLSWTSWDEQHVWSTTYVNHAEMPWLATVRGRAGLAAGSSLLYATGGIAIADLKHDFGDTPPPDVSISETEVGLAIGAGFEHGFGNGWSARLEAMHVAFPSIEDNSYSADDPMNFTNSATMARAAVTKRLNFAR